MAKKKIVRELTPKARLRLLTMPNWSYHEIMSYFGWGKNKAIDIKKEACAKGGLVKWHSDQATVKSIMELQGTTVDEEISRLEKILTLVETEKKEEN